MWAAKMQNSRGVALASPGKIEKKLDYLGLHFACFHDGERMKIQSS